MCRLCGTQTHLKINTEVLCRGLPVSCYNSFVFRPRLAIGLDYVSVVPEQLKFGQRDAAVQPSRESRSQLGDLGLAQDVPRSAEEFRDVLKFSRAVIIRIFRLCLLSSTCEQKHKLPAACFQGGSQFLMNCDNLMYRIYVSQKDCRHIISKPPRFVRSKMISVEIFTEYPRGYFPSLPWAWFWLILKHSASE